MSTAAFASFERKWLLANPEQAAVAIFLPPAQRLRASAFGCIVHELEYAVFHIEEPQVAATKLAWWQQELSDTRAGRPRHPLTSVLVAEIGDGSLDSPAWSALAGSALALLDRSIAENHRAQLAQLDTFYAHVAAIELALCGKDDAHSDANAALWTNSHLLHALAAWQVGSENLPIPMDLLARHSISRAELAQPGPARAMVLRDYLSTLGDALQHALQKTRSTTLGRRVRGVLDLRVVRTASHANDPLRYLHLHARSGHWRSLWCAWSQARILGRAG